MMVDIHAIPYARLGRIRFPEPAERGMIHFGLNETVRAAACQGGVDGPFAHAGRFGITSIGATFVGEHTHG
jgi:secreted trypsin-like serine protease